MWSRWFGAPGSHSGPLLDLDHHVRVEHLAGEIAGETGDHDPRHEPEHRDKRFLVLIARSWWCGTHGRKVTDASAPSAKPTQIARFAWRSP